MKKLFTIMLSALLLASMIVMPAAAADLNDNAVLWLDFEGATLEERLADKATAGKAADNAIIEGDLVKVENGTAYIPADEFNIIRVPVTDDTLVFNNMTVYCRVKITGAAITYGPDVYEIPKHLRIFADASAVEGLTTFTSRLMCDSKKKVAHTGFIYSDPTEWMHIAQTITYADGQVSGSVFLSTDGVNYTEFTGAYEGAYADLAAQINLGKTDNGNDENRGMNMEIDDFRIYNKVLTIEEVSSISDMVPSAGTGSAPAGTVAPTTTAAPTADTTAAPATTTAAPTTTPTTADSAVLFALFGAAALLTLTVGLRRRTGK